MSDDLDTLQKEINEAKKHTAPHHHNGEPPDVQNSSQAMQMATSFVAGAVVGGGIGYCVDRWLNSSPIGLLIGFFLGFAAGVYSLMKRSAKTKI